MERVPGGPDDVGAHLVRGTGQRGRQAPLPEDGAALRIHDPHLDVGPAQIDAYVIHRISSYTVVSSSSPFPARAKPARPPGQRGSPPRAAGIPPRRRRAPPPFGAEHRNEGIARHFAAVIARKSQCIHCKVIALCKAPEAEIRRFRKHFRAGRARGSGRAQGHVERLVHMQLPRLPVRPDPPEVVDAVGRVGVLLDLREQDARADRVDRARADEEDVPLVHGGPVERLGDRVVRDPPAHLLRRNFPLKPKIEEGIRLAVDDIPHLGLAAPPLDAAGVAVVRVHLD